MGYHWPKASVLQPLAPWLGVLLLLTLKTNRRGQAWWIWAPLGGLAGVGAFLPFLLGSLDSRMFGIFQDTFGVLVFSLAAVWLVATHLASEHRFATCLRLLLALAGFSLFGLVSQLRGGLDEATFPVGAMLGATSVVLAAALSLAGRRCRRRYRPAALGLWVAFFLFAAWLVVLSALFIPTLLGGGRTDTRPLVTAVLSMTALGFGALLPFLILSFTNSFYRERLEHLLGLTPDASPATGRWPGPCA